MGYPMPFAQLSADDTCTPVVRDKQAAEFKAFAKWVTVRNQAFGCYSEESVYRALWTVSPEKKGKVFVDIGANKGSCMSSPLFVVYSQFVLLPAARDSVGRVLKLLSPHVMREPRAARPEVRTHRAHDLGRVPAGKE